MSRSISKAVKVSAEWHQRLKVEAAQRGMSVQGLLEEVLARYDLPQQSSATGPVTAATGSLNEDEFDPEEATHGNQR